MRLFLPRLLMLGCGLLLALPPGWCCIFASEEARKETAKAAPCCRSCCGDKSQPATPTPAPDKPDRCPCADRQSTAPDTLKAFAPDLSLIAPLHSLDFPLPTEDAADHDGFRPLVSCSAHLLNCVWLC